MFDINIVLPLFSGAVGVLSTLRITSYRTNTLELRQKEIDIKLESVRKECSSEMQRLLNETSNRHVEAITHMVDRFTEALKTQNDHMIEIKASFIRVHERIDSLGVEMRSFQSEMQKDFMSVKNYEALHKSRG